MGKIKEQELTKLYYSIGEVADMFNVNASLIRFWEKEFPSVQPKKNKKGNRLFSPREIILLDKIYSLVKEQGYTLDGAKKALRQKNTEIVPLEPITEGEDVILKLEEVRSRLLGIKKRLSSD